MKILLTGASGFVGSHLLRRLLREGHAVRALVHRQNTLIDAGERGGQVERIQGDINSHGLVTAVAGCDAVINLVGIIYERGKATFAAVHHQGTKNLVGTAKAAGVKRFVQMSALGARAGDASPYHTTKFAAEEEVRNSGIPYAILRPSLIFGEGSAFLNQMVDVMRAAPFIRPVAGNGRYRFRPVHVDDVAQCFAKSLTNPLAVGQTINIVGGEELTLDEIAAEIAQKLKVRKQPVHVPIPLMKAAAAAFSLLPVQPPVTSVQIRMLQEGSTADPHPMKKIFGIDPIGFREGLRSLKLS